MSKISSNNHPLAGEKNIHRTALPWTEKYAPAQFEKVFDQAQPIAMMQKIVSNPPESAFSMPHLLLYGPSGVGKTSCVDLLVRGIFKTHDLRQRCVLKLNASDERGIAMMRTKVKRFAHIEPPPGAPFALIVLDECDNLTSDAQDFLRRQMEPDVSTRESRKPRYILMCNYVTHISEPIASRCQHFRFRAILGAPMQARLAEIAHKENFSCTPDVLAEIDRVAAGDARRAVTLLQHLCVLYGNKINAGAVSDVAGEVPASRVRAFLDACLVKRTIKAVVDCTEEIIVRQGYSGERLLSALAQLVLEADAKMQISPKTAAALIIERIAQAEYLLRNKADQYLQVLDVGSFCIQVIENVE